MSEIDWSQAPEGTTHYDSGQELWYRDLMDARLHYWDAVNGTWVPSAYSTLAALQAHYQGPVVTRDDQSVEPAKTTQTAADYCEAAKGHMVDRAATYDAPAGERSMAKTVTAFNALTGHQLTEEQGWLFMETLKMARSQQGQFRQDNYEDAVAYAALRGEAAGKERAHD